MRKFLCILMMLLCIASLGFSQNHVIPAKWNDNWNFGFHIESITPERVPRLNKDGSINWKRGIDYTRFGFGIELGKEITPVIGVSISEDLSINTSKNLEFFKLKSNNSHSVPGILPVNSKTAFDENKLYGNVHFNLTNLFYRYFDEPHNWEISLIPGIGWSHLYGMNGYSMHHNYVNFRLQCRINRNFGYEKQWQFNLRPGIEYTDRFRDFNGQFSIQMGLNYKFSIGHNGKRNFVNCPYEVTWDEHQEILRRLHEFEDTPVDAPKVVSEKVIEYRQKEYVLQFGFNSAELSDESCEILKSIPHGRPLNIEAFASSYGGSDATNQKISDMRAKAVKDYLEHLGHRIANVHSHGADSRDSATIVIVSFN